jgi:hypothetical protein
MKSKARVEAGRWNGLMARGKKSEEARQKCALNSVKHGLTAQTLVFANESKERFEAMRQFYYGEWQPESEYEASLVDLTVTNHRRIHRTMLVEKETIDLRQARMEHSCELKKEFDVIPEPVRLAIAYEKETNGPNTLDKVGRYEARFSRSLLKYTRALLDYRERKNVFLPNESNEHANED